MKKWESVKFSDAFDFAKKSSTKAGDGIEGGKYPFFTSSGVLSKRLNEFHHDKPSLIFGTGGMASVHYCDEKFAVSTDCFVTQVKDEKKFSPKFLYYFLSGNMYLLEEGFKGAGLKHISKEYINKIVFPLPLLPTQQKIAAILDRADALRQKDKQLLVSYDALAQSVFYTLFGEPVKNEKGWEVKTLREMCKVTKLAGYEYTEHIKYQDEGEIIVIRGLNVKKGKLKLDNVKYIDRSVSDYLKRSKLYKGDVVMTYIGINIGDLAIVEENDKFHLAPNVAKITPLDNTSLNSNYLMAAMEVSKPQFLKFTTNTAKQAFNMDNIREVKILVPPISLQTQFATIISKIEQQKHQAMQQLQKSEELFQSLLQRAFKGELVE